MARRIMLARLLILGAFACGLVGLIAGLIEREWRLAVTGWFTGGILLAALALAVFVEQYFEERRRRDRDA